MSKIKPIDFIGIGAVKGGSSWVHNILSQHPDIEMATRKEVVYFNEFDVTGIPNPNHNLSLDYYYQFWEFDSSKQIRGEFSPQYLTDANAAKRIKATFPNTKLICVLRNPVQRALSHFEYDQYFNTVIPKELSFLEAAKQFQYLLSAGEYAHHLEHYLSNFDTKNIHVIILEEAIQNPEQMASNLFKFLCVPLLDSIDFEAVNERKKIKYKTINSIIKFPGKINKTLNQFNQWQQFKSSKIYTKLLNAKTFVIDKNAEKKEKSTFDKEILTFLQEHYKPYNQQLETLLKRDLSTWNN